jgi:hypothetical protein
MLERTTRCHDDGRHVITKAHSDGIGFHAGWVASIGEQTSVGLSWISGFNHPLPPTTRLKRSIRALVVACVLVVLVASTQLHLQPAQGATQSTRSIFKGSPLAVERRLCLAIPVSAVAPLYSVKVGPPKGAYQGATCYFIPAGMSVQDDDSSPLFVVINIDDYGQTYGTFDKHVDHKLSGIGDKAYWFERVPGTNAPQVNAEKGKVGCMASTNGEVDHTTLSYTISGGNPVVTNVAAAKFAAKLGVVCADVFKGK